MYADGALVDSAQPSERTLEIVVAAPDAAPRKDRPPLNLALVIDRSGSMEGDKLASVKRAACHAIDLLDARDRAAVVAYDDNVNRVASGKPMTADRRAELKRRIEALRTRGSTNLCGGWLHGAGEVAGALLPDGVNRTLLLTDGLANVGVTDVEELTRHARELRRRGVATTTFGVGVDYDEHLLSAMAEQGGGHFYFIRHPRQIPEFFQRELGEMLTVVAREACLTLTLPAGISAQLLGDLPHETEGGRLRLFLGDLFAGERRAFYLRAQTPPALAGDRLEFRAEAGYATLENRAVSERATLFLTYAETAEVEAAPQDGELLARAGTVYMAGAEAEALRRRRAGDRSSAARVMYSALDSVGEVLPFPAMAEFRLAAEGMEEEQSEEYLKTRHARAYERRHQRK
jgi:Ca-activated chloride channel family protein